MIKVFVSGCYDILHAGHIRFFEDAKKFGDFLVVNIASDEVIQLCKDKKPSLPLGHRVKIVESLSVVDSVCVSNNVDDVFDFESNLKRERPDYLISSDDDKNAIAKNLLCKDLGIKYITIPKELPFSDGISTSKIISLIKRPERIPLRVDFAGGWLDVPEYARDGAFVVNCTIDKFMDENCEFKPGSGLGGSAAFWLYKGKDPVQTELNNGVGWQDAAVCLETGACSWKSGKIPVLNSKVNPEFLIDKMALLYNEYPHDTAEITGKKRDYDLIEQASIIANDGVRNSDLGSICDAVNMSYSAQLLEGMKELPDKGELAKKYCGSGWGGCALYIFDGNIPNDLIKIQPYIKGY